MHVLIWFFRLRSDTTLGLLFDADFLDDPKHCPHPGLSSSSSPLLGDTPGDQPFLPPGFLAAVLGLAVIGITVTLMGALAFILLVQHHPMATVVATLAAQVMVPAAVGVMAMKNGKPNGRWGECWPFKVPAAVGVMAKASPFPCPYALLAESQGVAYVCFALSAALALCYLLYNDSIRVVGRLLSVSATALRAIPGLLLLVALLKIVLLVMSTLMVAAGALAATNGQALANPLRGRSPGVLGSIHGASLT